MSSPDKKNRLDFALLGKSALLALCGVLLKYVVNAWFSMVFKLDLRFIWPFFKTFTWVRFGQFLLYLPIFCLFYIMNNSKIFAALRSEATYERGVRGFWACWWRNAVIMTGGLLLVTLIEYIPFFLGMGPGADLLFGSTFGGPFMSLLILFVPQVVVFSLICTWLYRKNGNIYPGAFFIAMLACWIVTGGSSML